MRKHSKSSTAGYAYTNLIKTSSPDGANVQVTFIIVYYTLRYCCKLNLTAGLRQIIIRTTWGTLGWFIENIQS